MYLEITQIKESIRTLEKLLETNEFNSNYQKVIHNLLIKKVKRIFLIDGLGALLTTISLGFILPKLENVFGMPTNILHLLATIAFVFATYSLINAYNFFKNWRMLLKIIAFSNLFYCLLTLIVIFIFYNELTNFDILYFSIEILIILFLVIKEFKLAAS